MYSVHKAHKYFHLLVQIIIFLWIINQFPPGFDFPLKTTHP